MNETPETLRGLKNIHPSVASWLGHELAAHAAAWEADLEVSAIRSLSNAALKADRDALREAVVNVRAKYPEDIFPPDGASLDCKGAKMARLTCDNILAEAERLASLPPDPGVPGVEERTP